MNFSGQNDPQVNTVFSCNFFNPLTIVLLTQDEHAKNGRTVNFMFEFPCIITLYYIKNQLDATLAVLLIMHCKITLHVSEAESVRNM